MIHGDYHTKNVMLQKGEVLLIDMDTLSYGHPIFEFASMYLGFVGFGEADPSQAAGQFLGIPYDLAKTFFHKCMAEYLGTTDEKKIAEVVDKSRILGYARLLRRSIRRYGLEGEEGKASIALCKKELADLLPRYQTLTF
jgi:aminoglycoside phosphotransferase (APT) family kinase protein